MTPVEYFKGHDGCMICDTTYEEGETFETHVKKSIHKKNKKKLYCSLCKQQCASNIEFIRHTISTEHNAALKNKNKPEDNFFCSLCHIQCSNNMQFGQHMISKGHMKKLNVDSSDQKTEILKELIKLITTVLDNEHFPYEEGLIFIKKVNLDMVVLIDQCETTNKWSPTSTHSSVYPFGKHKKGNNANTVKSIDWDEETRENVTVKSNDDKDEEVIAIANTDKESMNAEAAATDDTVQSDTKEVLKHDFTLENIPDMPKLLAVIRMELYQTVKL
ncbi:hypothetical protein GWI33_000439 [Rhynchophorus ferrugineus]|uniref:C2H2-type domain-containing protein n=1 Tax=Rhynchophorus ferrugineus TaxID=354439 RepID=A0A834HLA2_RHYFE|nr:hypothetical protein GWI33_000439 [Rhynchophorus ferrugineus]